MWTRVVNGLRAPRPSKAGTEELETVKHRPQPESRRQDAAGNRTTFWAKAANEQEEYPDRVVPAPPKALYLGTFSTSASKAVTRSSNTASDERQKFASSMSMPNSRPKLAASFIPVEASRCS